MKNKVPPDVPPTSPRSKPLPDFPRWTSIIVKFKIDSAPALRDTAVAAIRSFRGIKKIIPASRQPIMGNIFYGQIAEGQDVCMIINRIKNTSPAITDASIIRGAASGANQIKKT